MHAFKQAGGRYSKLVHATQLTRIDSMVDHEDNCSAVLTTFLPWSSLTGTGVTRALTEAGGFIPVSCHEGIEGLAARAGSGDAGVLGKLGPRLSNRALSDLSSC